MEFTKDIKFSNILRGNKISQITYTGDLFQKNSESVAIVYGFGENWEHTTEQDMEKTENGFITEIEMKNDFDTFNFCFRNGNYEWDNNQSFNYISPIQPAILDVKQVETVENFRTNLDETNSIDVDFIIEVLDSLLKEELITTNNVSVQNSEKQQILEDILAEEETTVQSPVLMENFDMDALIENILNPVINFEKTEEDEFENIINFQEIDLGLQEELKQELENSIANFVVEENNVAVAETKESESALIPTSEDVYLVSPRKLRKFYLLTKRIKLAFYKLFVAVPKLLFGNFGENQD